MGWVNTREGRSDKLDKNVDDVAASAEPEDKKQAKHSKTLLKIAKCSKDGAVAGNEASDSDNMETDQICANYQTIT